MPRYYLQLRNHTEEMLDPEGMEYPDEDALVSAALFNARDLIAGEAQRGVVDLRFRIDAEDEHGSLVYSLPFTDAVKVILDS